MIPVTLPPASPTALRDGLDHIRDSLLVLDCATIDSPALCDGHAGLAVFHAYASALTGAAEHEAKAMQHLSEAVSAADSLMLAQSLYSGLTGIAWAVEHVGALFGFDTDDTNDDVDEALIDVLSGDDWTREFDLLRGLAGVGVYAIERLPRDSAATLLSLVVRRLDETAHQRDGCATWSLRTEWLPEPVRRQYVDGEVNLGVAHGIPGVVAVLSAACQWGVADSIASPLLERAGGWIAAQRRANLGLPHRILPDGTVGERTRDAWCYGDLGVSAVLLNAARRIDQQSLAETALALARDSAKRDPQCAGVEDGGLCHGAAGNAHLCGRLAAATGDERLHALRDYWLAALLHMRQPGRGCGGFRAYEAVDLTGPKAWVDAPGFINGAAGIGLALVGALDVSLCSWDRILLLSLRGTPQ